MKYRTVTRRALMPAMDLDTAWAIRDSSGRLIQSELERWGQDPKAFHERRAALEVEAAAQRRVVDPFEDGPGYELHGRVAVIRFEGCVSKRLSWWGYLLGGTASTEVLAESIQNALGDAAVASILLYIDSPGGSIRGVREVADLVYATRTKKAIWTLFSDCGASAAYEIGSQATKCYASTPDTDVGSIGVLMSFFDYSGALAQNGVKAEIIRSAPLKGTGSFGTSLTPEQRAYLQETVDTSAANFTETVARGRGFTPEQAAAVSTGRTYMAAEALSLGLIDGISTLSDLIGPLEAEGPVVPESALIEPVEAPDHDDVASAKGGVLFRDSAGNLWADSSAQAKGTTDMAESKASCTCCADRMCSGCKTCTCDGSGTSCTCCKDMKCTGCKNCTHAAKTATATEPGAGAAAAGGGKTKFKNGDRVEATANHSPGMSGMVGKVSIVRETPPYYAVTFDKPMDGMKSPHKWLAEDELKAAGKSKSMAETGRDESGPITGTGAPAPKENDMDEAQITALIAAGVAQAVGPLKAQLDSQAAENATLKAKLDATSGTVTEVKSDRDLERLLADAKGENGGPPKLAGDASDPKSVAFQMEQVIRKAWAVNPDAARAVVANLPTLGKGTGSVVRGTAAHPAGSAAGSNVVRLPVDFVGSARGAYQSGRFSVHDAAIERLRVSGPGPYPPDAYRQAVIEVTRRSVSSHEAEAV